MCVCVCVCVCDVEETLLGVMGPLSSYHLTLKFSQSGLESLLSFLKSLIRLVLKVQSDWSSKPSESSLHDQEFSYMEI